MYPIVNRTKKIIYTSPFDNPDYERAEKQSKELFYKYLPSLAYISVLEDEAKKNEEERNQWQIIYIFVLGEEGSGKSVTINCLAQWFRDYYEGRKKRYEDSIYCAATAKELNYLYNTIPKNKKYIFLAAEDMTGVDIDIHITKRRRWICQERTGYDAGTIVQVGGLHDWFSVHKMLRDASSLVIAKSSKAKLNNHDAGHQLKFMSANGVKFAELCAKYRNYIKNQKTKGKVKKALAQYEHYFGYGTVWEKTTEKVRLWYNPDVDINLTKIYDLQYRRQGEEDLNSGEIYELPQLNMTEPDYFEWREPVFKILQDSSNPKIKKFAKFFKAKYIDDLDYNRQETWDILELHKTQIHNYYREMENGQKAIGGFISKVRGELFEKHILAVCEQFGIAAEPGPTIHYNGYEYEDDIKILDKYIINAKCGKGLRQYTREKKLADSGESVKGHYKSTFVFAKNDFETYILYYDLETDLVTIIDTNSILTLDKINVGGKRKDFPQLPLTQALGRILRLTPASFSSPVAEKNPVGDVQGELQEKGQGGDTVKALKTQKEEK